MTHPIAFVTAYRDIQRDKWKTFARSRNDYIDYFLLLASNIPYTLIVYVENHLGLALQTKIKRKNIIFMDIRTVPTFYDKYLSQDQQVMQSTAYQEKIPLHRRHLPEHVSSNYNLVMHSKINFVKHAAEQYSMYSWYAWIDFGYVRQLRSIPRHINMLHVPKHQVTCHCIQTPKSYQSANDMLASSTIFLTGGSYIVPATMISSFESMYEQELKHWYQNNITDDDQSLLLQLYFKHRDVFCLKHHTEWMSLYHTLQTPLEFANPTVPPTQHVPVTSTRVRVNEVEYELPRSNTVRLLTVGTNPTDGYLRFIQSVKHYDYRVLGFGDQWNGGNMAKGPGGGKKVVYLKQYLEQHFLPEYMIFTDCYDVVVLAEEDEVMATYKKYFDGKIVFGAERFCWPDKNRAAQYPSTPSSFKYLNSGLFMGPTRLIQDLLDNAAISPTDDDQRFYTTLFLKQSQPIVLDYEGHIFQNLAGTQASEFSQTADGRIANNKNGHLPGFLHGNGPGLPVLSALVQHNG